MQRTDGTEVGGRYLLTARIAHGGMGEVWRASDSVLERPIAVKLLRAGLADDPEFLARFRIEARNAARLSHGNIAQVHDYGEDLGTAFLVMELVDGVPLSALIEHDRPMPPQAAVHLLVQASNALHAAHTKGIVHRDVKPANIVVDDESVAKLTDFGIARALDGSSLTRAGEVMGTPQYLSPEAALGKEATAQSDIYSLAVVAFQLLTGTLPFAADTALGYALAHVNQPVPELPGTIEPALAGVVRAGLAKDPDQRPPGAAAFAAQLQAAIAGDAAGRPVAPVRVAHLPDRAPTTRVTDRHQVGAPEPQAAFTLRRGQNAPLPPGRLSVRVEAARVAAVDVVACCLDAKDRAPGDDALVFFNNRASPGGGVRLTGSGRVEVDLALLPPEVSAVVVGTAIEPPRTLGDLADLRVTLEAGTGEQRATFLLPAVLGDERAAVLVRLYRRDSGWKVRNVAAGWQSGLAALVAAFGLTVSDTDSEPSISARGSGD